MAIQIVPKDIAKKPFWLNILFYFSLVLLIGLSASYFTLNYFIQKADQRIQELDEELEKAKTPEEIALEGEVLGYQEKIGDFSVLIKDHRFNSNLFSFLENLTHPKVWFSNFTLDSEIKKVKISGETESFQTLGQQLIIFQNEEHIKKVDLSNIALGERGKIEFDFDLLLDPKIFKNE